MTKCKLERTGFISSSRYVQLWREVKAKTEAKPGRNMAYWLAPRFMFSYLSFTIQAHLPRDCTTYQLLINKMPSQTCSWAKLLGKIPQLIYLLPR